MYILYFQQIEKPFSVWTYQDVIDFLAEKPVSTIFKSQSGAI